MTTLAKPEDTRAALHEVALILRAERRARSWSQSALGEAVGVTGSAVGSWEREEDAPTRENAERLDNLFGFDDSRISRLLRYSPVEQPSPDRIDDLVRRLSSVESQLARLDGIEVTLRAIEAAVNRSGRGRPEHG